MGREAAITGEDVFREADLIAASGKGPEARAIRTVLGKGSMGTIQKHLQKWRESKAPPPLKEDTILEPDVVRAINRMLASRLKEATSENIKKIDVLNNDIAALIEENERQEQELERLKNGILALQRQNHEQVGKIQQLTETESRVQERAKEEIRARMAAQMAAAKAEAKLELFHQVQTELKEALSAAKRSGEEAAELRSKYAILLENHVAR